MARIRWVNEPEATGAIGKIYQSWRETHPGRPEIPEILKALSLQPDLLRRIDEISDDIHFRDGHLSWRVKEMIATYVSALNQCPYCTGSHAYFLSEQVPVAELHECLARAEPESAPLTDAERGLLSFVKLVTQESYKTTDRDVELLREKGWTDPQIAECVYITSLFAFFNRVANAFGLEDPNFFQEPTTSDGKRRSHT